MAMALEELGWEVLFLGRSYRNGICDEPGFHSRIVWVNGRGGVLSSERAMVSEYHRLLLEWGPSVVMFEPPGFRYVASRGLATPRQSRPPKLVLDVRTPVVCSASPVCAIHWMNWLAGLLFARKFCSGVTVITEPLAKFVRRFIGKRHHIQIWTSGVDLRRFDPATVSPARLPIPEGPRRIFLYHGSIGMGRGLPELVTAFARARKVNPQLWLVILGGSPAEQTMLQRAFSTAGGASGLVLLPPVENSLVPSYVAASDVGVCPLPPLWRWAVSSPLKVLEYMAMAKPVLVTDIPAHRAIVKEGEVGLFVNDFSVESLCAGFLRMETELAQLRARASGALPDTRSRISWSMQAERLSQYLESLFDGRSQAMSPT
jgi:glycosyltransferase involved in cell wall biosynthesis